MNSAAPYEYFIQNTQTRSKAVRTEEYPAQAYEYIVYQYRTRGGKMLFIPAAFGDRFVNAESQSVQSTPDNEGPACPMPQSAEYHCKHQIDIGSCLALSVAAERNIQIFLKPG